MLGGIGKTPAIVALTLYALLPIIRSTYTALKQIDSGQKEAALALGMRKKQVLLYVELPQALPVIISGVRVATVICVGIATIAAAIGGGGLGVFIFRGIATVNNIVILAGAIPSAIIALIADWGIGYLEKILSKPQFSRRSWQKIRLLLLSLLAFLVLIFWQQATNTSPMITIGSKNFTEQVILGEILAQQIESSGVFQVKRQFNLGGTFICHEAVKAGKIDGYVEYSGTALTAILKQQPLKDPKQTQGLVKQAYREKFGLAVFPSLGFENTFAIVIRGEDARKYNLKTISDAAVYTPNWRAAFGYEFITREDGLPGLSQTYNLAFAESPQSMELGLIYRALADKQVDLVAGNSTDGLIKVLDLYILTDDRKYFPPYDAVVIFHQETLDKYPQLTTIINRLNGAITATEMQELNYLVDNQLQSVESAVREFIRVKNF
ncbi:osmoprotectant binding protein [Gloeocapsa sp. PCC 73106]|nr:glycine betaine ABC transporter substrate-binding protein [Gloeocapsa sp. PCC 73106]ELS00060.1 osmoprotectant binding protein [Gloeocapsa sp. PCC 73106]